MYRLLGVYMAKKAVKKVVAKPTKKPAKKGKC